MAANALNGVDVSLYQGDIDWKILGSRVFFAGIKATEGDSIVDPKLFHNWSGAWLSGVHRIAYHFFYDNLDPVKQANFFHKTVRDNGHFTNHDAAMVDVEEVSVKYPLKTLDLLEKFLEQASRVIDKQIFIYTNADTWMNMLGNPVSPYVAKFPLWLADLGPYIPHINQWPNGLSILQYSFQGHELGIPGPVDMDRFYGTPEQYKELIGAH